MHLNLLGFSASRLLGFSASRLLSVTAACIFPVMAQLPDTDRDGIPNSTDPFPTVNAVVADPDGNNNLSAGFQSGLIGRWDFETMAVSGTNYSFADIAGGDQPLNCRQLSMSIDNSGMISKGALFDAGNDHLTAPGTLFHNRTAFSTSMWFKIPPGYIQNKAGNIHTVFFACNGALDAYPELIVSIYKGVPGSTTQKITVSRYNGTTLTITFFGEIPVADYLDDGFWNHLAFVKNGNNSRLFVNGVKIKESNITNPTLTATTAGYISYGKTVPVATDQGHTFRGSMDRIRFYSRNLSDAEVTELYRQDSDRDGFPDIVEKDWGTTYPLSPFYWQSPEQDSDQDGLPDFWERLYGLDPLNTTGINGGTGDGDGDGVTNINEFQNSTSPGKKDTDGDGVSDAIEVSQGSDANSAADSGKPPTDPLESVTFRTGGDYATWQMNITGLGPRDFRKLQVTAPKFNDFITVTHKLRKNNSYQIKLTHTGSRPDQPDTWYCWEAQVNGFPTTASFTTSAANTLGVRTTTGLATVINNHWVVDNTSGLLTTHLHSKSINKVSSLTTYLLPIDIEEVISDQIAGNEANKLPTAFYGKQPNNPMLMATRTGKDARLQIVVDVPDAFAADIRVGVRVVDNPTVILGSAATLPGGVKTPLAFTAVDGKKLYEVVVGYDKNHDSILTDDEVVGNFEKTPKTDPGGGAFTGSDTTFDYLDKILIVTRNDFDAARKETEDYGDSTFFTTLRPEGAKLLKLFGTGGTLIAGADPTTWGHMLDANVIPSPQGLSHPLGAVWNASNQATTLKITYPTTSDLAAAVVDADGFAHLVGRIIFVNKAALAASASGTYKTSAPIPFSDNKIAFADTDNQEDVHLALGKCNAVGNLIVKYRSAPGGKIEVSEVNCYGTISDLYDWAFGTKLTFPVLGNQIDLTKDAARTQAGYATLSPVTAWPCAGRVFFTEVKFGSGWINWNNTVY